MTRDMKENKENSRMKLKSLLTCREVLDAEIRATTAAYLEEYSGQNIIWISDHAIIRYIERVKKHVVPEGISDKDRVVKYLDEHRLNGEKFREGILTQDEQILIARNDVRCFHKDGFRYVIKGLALVSVVPNKKKEK